ncbi:hypothetical protein [Methylomonas albis]|nr:hypothetical protein [Methylomonas albis]
MQKTDSEIHPNAFLNGAIEYCEAGSILLKAKLEDSENKAKLNPIYMLCSHATELALKAFLRHKNYPTKTLKQNKYRHNLVNLYNECRASGLTSQALKETDFINLVQCLHSGNDEMAYRYFNPNPLVMPEIKWTNEAVISLIDCVKHYLPDHLEPQEAIKFDLIIGKPTSS